MAASSRRTVQPAAPRGEVQPAAPRRSVQPASAQVAPVAAGAGEASAELTDDIALVHIYRVGQLAGAAIGYDIHLDDQVIWRARNKSKATIRMGKAGIAALWAKTESRIDLPIDIRLGHEYYVRCGVRMGAFVGRPGLELVDAATGRAEFESIPVEAQVVDLAPSVAAAPVVPLAEAVAPEPEPIPEPKPDTLAAPVLPPPPAPEPVSEPEPIAEPAPEPAPKPAPKPLPIPEKGIANDMIEILVAADSLLFRPAPGIEIPTDDLNVTFYEGDKSHAPRQFNARGSIKFDMKGMIYFDKSLVTVKLDEAPAGFRPQRVVFTVAGKKSMTFDLARKRWVN
jgi:hypothetical protein